MLRRLAPLVAALLLAGPALAVPAAWSLLGGFAPVTHTYTSGSGTETVPAGATQVVISVWHGGAAGGYDGNTLEIGGGGGGGGGAQKTISVVGGNTFSYSVAASVVGRGTTGPGLNGNLSTVSGTVSGGSVSISGTAATGGNLNAIAGVGGVGTGGDSNYTGNDGSSSVGGNGATVGGVQGPGNGGDGSGTLGSGPSSPGANGRISFAYS